MRNAIQGFSAVVVFSLLAAAPAWSEEKKAVEADVAKLDGTYAFISLETNGRLAPEATMKEFKDVRLTIKGDTVTMLKPGEKPREQQIMIDNTKSPKHIDIVETSGKEKRTTIGIYSLDGKRLVICADDSGKVRPTEFGTKGKPSVTMATLERQ